MNWENIKKEIYDNIYTPSVYEKTLGFFHVRKRFISPFRQDKHPDCSFYKDKNNIWLWHDFVTQETFDIFKTYQMVYNISFYEAVCQIAEEYNLVEALQELGLTFKSYVAAKRTIVNKQLESSNSIDMIKKYQELIKRKIIDDEDDKKIPYVAQYTHWQPHHIQYWKDRDIDYAYLGTTPILVIPAETVTRDGKVVFTDTEDSPIFCFVDAYTKDLLQVYRPYSSQKKNKFRSNTADPFFLATSPKRPNIFTKSYKDGLLLYKSGFNAFGYTGEGKMPSAELFALLDIHKPIYIFFDNDEAGRKASQKMCKFLEEKNFIVRIIEAAEYVNLGHMKDYDDMCKILGLKSAQKFIKRDIKKLE